MAVIKIGLTTATYQPDGNTVTQSPDGSGEAVLVYKVTSVGFTLASLPAPLSAHPQYSELKLYQATAALEPGSVMSVTCTYRGVIVDDPSIYKQQEFNATTSNEPVETHPKFAYPPGNPPVTAAELDAINKYLTNNATYSLSVAGATAAGVLLWGKKRRGITNFMAFGASYREQYVQEDIPQDYSAVGVIDDPIDAPAPPLGRNYIKTGLSWRKAGGTVTVNEEWQMSGRAGWDTDLYTQSQV